MDAAAVDCVGPGCPDLLRFTPEWRVAVEPWIADRLLRRLAEGFASAQGLTLSEPAPATLEFSAAARVLLRMQVLPLSGAADAVLAAGAADAALAVPGPGRNTGPLIARLPLAPASAPDAPAGPLALRALQSARQDPAPTWTLTGERDRPLVWHAMPDGSALERTTETALGPARGPQRKAGTLAALAVALSRDPWGLAFLPTPLPEGLTRRAIHDDCGLVTDISDFAAAAGDHPFLMGLHWLPGNGRAPPIVRDFIDWTTTPSARAVMAAAGAAFPSVVQRRPLAAQGLRLANALAAAKDAEALAALQSGVGQLADAEQLALSFSFDPQGGTLDAASLSLLDMLSMHLATGAFRGSDLLLVGLTSSDEASEKGLARARDLVARLQAIPDLPDDTTITALGLGAILPVACPETSAGRRLNRRVEVWVRPRR